MQVSVCILRFIETETKGLLLPMAARAGLRIAGAILQSGTHVSAWALQRDPLLATEFGLALAAQVSSLSIGLGF